MMAEQWLNLDELKDLTGWSGRTVQQKAQAGELRWRRAEAAYRNGRPIRQYSVLSLSADLQAKLQRHRAAVCRSKSDAPDPKGSQLVLFSTNRTPAEARPLPVAIAQSEQIESRIATIQPLIEYLKLDSKSQRQAWCFQHGRVVANSNDLALLIANENGCSRATIWRWLAAYERGGANELFDLPRKDKGQSRWFASHPQVRVFAAYLYLNERQSISFVRDQIEQEVEMLGLTSGDLPGWETVRAFLSQDISPAMKVYAREGRREYRERMAPYLKRGYTDVWANQIWVGDHAIHDVEVSNDLFEDVPFGTPGRLRISAFVDYRSRKAWGTWAWEGSSRSIGATLLRAISEAGPPEGIYVDNGKDYKKVAKGAARACELPEFDDDDSKAPKGWYQEEYTQIERTGLLRQLGISVTHCIPRHPQSKHVERFFRTMHMHFDAVHGTYTSGSPFTRPEATEVAMARHRRLLKAGRVEESDHPLASRFILGCLSWIGEYNDTPQSGEGMDGRAPNQVFESERNPKQKPAPDPAALASLFCERAARTVHECAVRLKNYRYLPRPEDRPAWAAMHEANETEILVDYNPEEPEFALALTMDGRILAWLEAEPLLRFAPNDPKTQAQIAESMQNRRGLEKATKETLRTIEAAARSLGALSAEEMLYKRLKLPAITGAVITQRKPRFRPERNATAPLTAAEIAADFLEKVG
jgi:hypothetical protein